MMAVLVSLCRRRNLRFSGLGSSWISSFALPTSRGFISSSPSPLIIPSAPDDWRKKGAKDQDQCDTEEINLLEQVATRPVLVTIDAGGSDFQFYLEGLFDRELGDELNHVIAITGYGRYYNGKRKWIIANSWGTDWGENGFMTIKRDVCVKEGLCWTTMMACYLIKISPQQQLNIVPQFFNRLFGINPTLAMNRRPSCYLKPPSFMFSMLDSTPVATQSYLQEKPKVVAPSNSSYEFQSSGSNLTFMLNRLSCPSYNFIYPYVSFSTHN